MFCCEVLLFLRDVLCVKKCFDCLWMYLLNSVVIDNDTCFCFSLQAMYTFMTKFDELQKNFTPLQQLAQQMYPSYIHMLMQLSGNHILSQQVIM